MTTGDSAPPLEHPMAPRRSAAVLYVLGLVLVAAAGVFAVRFVRARHGAEAAEASARKQELAGGTRVLVTRVASLPAGRTVTLPAEVHAWRQATLYAKVSGYVKRMSVDKGDRVKEGQLIATLESPETDQARLSAKAAAMTKRLVANRYTDLAPKGVVSQQELDTASGDLAVAQAELARTAALEAYEEIRAPFDGLITARFVDQGALLPAATGSTSSAQPVVEVTDMSRVRIYAYLGQGDAPFVKEGTVAKLESDAHPGQAVDATVTRITRELDEKTRTMLTEIDIENKDTWVYPGLYLRVTMKLDTPPALAIPADAVFLRDGTPVVVVVDGGKARFTSIETGDDDGRIVRVISGLSEGQVIALHVGDEVSDGSPVQAVAPGASASGGR
jgi:membrane fusion protein, multidrug efflux system